MPQLGHHPWHQAATYIKAAFVEATDPTVIRTTEQAARLLERAANEQLIHRGTNNMEYIQDPIYNGNVTVSCTPEEWEAMHRKQEEQARQRYINDPQAAANKLYGIAVTDTGGGRAASALLLSLWNNRFAANMRDVVSSLDIDNTQAMLALLTHVGPCHHLERYLTEEQIIRVIDVWGDQHERKLA